MGRNHYLYLPYVLAILVNMETNKVVVRYKDGSLKKGKTADFFPTKKTFHLELLTGEVVSIKIDDLKAIFFVKNYIGNESYNYNYNCVIHGGGKKIKVFFSDGEVITGYTQGYSAEREGFFILPADKDGNNQRIFVIKSATEKVEFIASS